jgi:hypothetical protein
MKHKNLLLVAFALVALAQLLVPTLMISYKADYALKGKEFIFKVRHNRTGSSIRGNYLWLQFEADKFKVKDRKEWENSQSVFVTFDTDSLGYACVKEVTKERPVGTEDWLKVKAFLNVRDSIGNRWVGPRGMLDRENYNFLRLSYPFSNYLTENTKARESGRIFQKAMNDTLKTISLKVHIRENQYAVGNLMVDSVRYSDFVKGL